ncbi:uncharacterized protein LOC141640768 [Silene latifolia]|uniref:uncharacterized protein LOC141640768 n=1 Tax=Silene latifolia TaxID=37657 RepID=UPI003D77210B
MVREESPPPPLQLPPNEIFRQSLSSQQVRIQIALVVTFLFYIAVMMLGRLRSRGRFWMKFISTISFMIADKIINYIPGLMSAPGASNDLYIFWISFMAYLYAVAHEISCYTLEENGERRKKLLIDYSVVWTLIVTSLYDSLAAPEILVPIILLFWVVVLKFRERRHALMFADHSSNGFSQATKIISDFTDYQEKHHQVGNNNFLVGVREAQKMAADEKLHKKLKVDLFDPSNIITLANVLDSDDEFLKSSETGKELKKTCISFAMFWTLLAKMGGYDKVDTKIFKDEKVNKLLAPSFDLVEEELDFLYEFIFSNSYAIYYRGFWKKLRDLLVITLFCWLTLPLFIEYQSQDHNLLFVYMGDRVLDTGFTRGVILAILIIEYVLIGMFLSCKWAKVMYTCAYLENEQSQRKSSIIRIVIRLACLIPRPKLSLWLTPIKTRKIGQYSVWNCYGTIPIPFWAKCWIGDFIDLPKIGQAGETFIDLEDSYKTWILASIEERNGKFTNGVHSLLNNKVKQDVVDKYVDVTNKKPQARVILIWHMATGLFEEEATTPRSATGEKDYFKIATTFSKYCAYLVAFLPQVLPDHVYTTQCEFDEVIRELKEELLNENENENKVIIDAEDPNKLVSNGNNEIIVEARKLKKKLEEQPDLWKTLAEFWTEKLLYMALADHDEVFEAHANSLCTGGEFITLLWALVTHAGCSQISPTLPQHQEAIPPNIEMDHISTHIDT